MNMLTEMFLPKLIKRRQLLLGLSALAGGLAGCDQLNSLANLGKGKATFKGIDITGASWASGFSLTDMNGQVRQLSDYKGKIVTVFFGFLNCPDFCPTHLARQVEVLRLLGKDADQVQTIFISVDPERDTPEKIKQFLSGFHPSFIGLTGSLEKLTATSKDFRAFFAKTEMKGSAMGYSVDHTTNTTVFDKVGKVRLMLRHELSAADVAADLKLLL